MFSQYAGIECDSAGLHESANVYLSPEQLLWADIVFVMEKAHRNKLSRKFKRHLDGKKVIVLGIPDEYDYMDPVLVHLLEQKVTPFLKLQPYVPTTGKAMKPPNLKSQITAYFFSTPSTTCTSLTVREITRWTRT